jgi:hypothetical protein
VERDLNGRDALKNFYQALLNPDLLSQAASQSYALSVQDFQLLHTSGNARSAMA